jgi:hypothetical protein
MYDLLVHTLYQNMYEMATRGAILLLYGLCLFTCTCLCILCVGICCIWVSIIGHVLVLCTSISTSGGSGGTTGRPTGRATGCTS